MFEYNYIFGEYSDDLRVRIELKAKDGLSPEDYTEVRQLVKRLEQIMELHKINMPQLAKVEPNAE